MPGLTFVSSVASASVASRQTVTSSSGNTFCTARRGSSVAAVDRVLFRSKKNELRFFKNTAFTSTLPKNVRVAAKSISRAISASSSPQDALAFISQRASNDIEIVKEWAVQNRQKLTVPSFLAASAGMSQMFPENASAATSMMQFFNDPSTLMSMMPLATVEVGKHWYWEVGPYHVHGQVLLVSWIVMGTVLAVLYNATRSLERVPSGWQNFAEFVYDFIEDIAVTNIPKPEYKEWIPFVGTLFLFIFASNWAGALVPWKLIEIPEGELAAPTNDINTTVAMALMVSAAYFYAGFKGAGLGYFTKYIKPTPLLLPINVIEDFTKPLSLSFRLFGNILADELVVAVLCLLVPLVVPLPAMVLGLFTSAIQALIFATLASTYIGEAVEVGHELHHEEEGHHE
mmetsp:Transcript_30885/g.49963  ORF Transcript_30885/g.49963 Transcript_30885/m.49963 type:complete len:400 (+) Transcript_30885:136-1335(+)|eukprot:CAMPEP_0184667610 /NCGR_PEP_ID=MMETSP0308-20130426/68321_1 /TAXON_ID=38269 /ORGANISM="Gloeochaete witrockiana, Strain SAG 46.84" /LENGTH=399 /DNA_ID=CAMNT_0027112913 /DNA_START=119 /DNA_END=1318 /DNA_ORIENTATION=-